MQESADNVSLDSTSPSKDALLEEACKKYDEATHLCPTLHDVCLHILCQYNLIRWLVKLVISKVLSLLDNFLLIILLV